LEIVKRSQGKKMAAVAYTRTRDGDLAARVAHMTFALVPEAGGMRMVQRYPAVDPELCSRSDFGNSGQPAANDDESFRGWVDSFASHHEQLPGLGRTKTGNDYTPWGRSDIATRYADGVVEYKTPGHGGFHLSDERNALVDEGVRSEDCWYEEDEDWSVVAMTFPELFTDRENGFANDTMRDAYPDAWERVTGRTLRQGESRRRDQDLFRTANAGRLMVISSCMSENEPGHVVATATIDGISTSNRSRRFLIEQETYDLGWRSNPLGMYVIDEARDREILADRG
jgi:hypothetical protein